MKPLGFLCFTQEVHSYNTFRVSLLHTDVGSMFLCIMSALGSACFDDDGRDEDGNEHDGDSDDGMIY